MNKKKLLATAALSGLMFAATGTTHAVAEEAAAPAGEAAAGECHGVNACKGTGDCGGKGYSCAGNNACKGQGWTKMGKDECEEKGGTFKGK